jgi:signal peptidase I
MSLYALGAKIPEGLFLRSSQLDKILIDNEIVKLSARGYSMYPSIMPGDILHARHKKFQEINIGEVVIFCRDGLLFAHRVIRKHEHNCSLGLITQADRSLSADGPLIPVEDILGVLIAVERKKRLINFDNKPLKSPSNIIFNILVLIDLIKLKLKPHFSRFLNVLSKQQIYLFFSRFLFPLPQQRLEFKFCVPFQLGEMGEFYKIVSLEDLVGDIRKTTHSKSLCFKITIKERNNFVAHAIFSPEFHGNAYGYRICALYFRMRYCGSSVIAILINKAREILNGSGGVCFFVDNSDEVLVLYNAFFLKAGFIIKDNYLEFNQ